MQLLDFLALTLAGSAIVDVWFNGSIFEGWRAYTQAAADGPMDTHDSAAAEPEETPVPWAMRLSDQVFSSFVAKLLTCSFCLSHWTPLILAIVFFIPSLCVEEPVSTLCKLPIYCLAATRLGNILNGLLPERSRYERNE